MLMDRAIKQIRTGDLVLHCVEVEVSQAIDSGIKMLGHGTIKINSVGTIYMEFICTYSENMPIVLFNEKIPQDPLNHEHKLYLYAKTINGHEYKSDGFFVEVNINSLHLPSHHYLILSSIYSVLSTVRHKEKRGNYLYFEFSESFSIPANKVNSVVSSLGSESSSWNQTVLEMKNYSISMVKHKGYTKVSVTGFFEPEKLLKCLRFYIGFSSASMPQLFYIRKIIDDEEQQIISSVVNKQKRQHSSSPMADNIFSEKYSNFNYHYNLLKNIISLYDKNLRNFESIYSQWERVWHSFQSRNSIMVLTLSVAVEGLLNDIYIPAIKTKKNDIELDKQITEVKKQIKSLDLTKEQRDRILGSISYWKNITAPKALDYLIDRRIITIDDKKLWQKLRNESAHPKVKESNLSKDRLEHEKVLSCLNLFHKLILNTLAFSGPIIVLQVGKESTCKELIHIDILS